MLHVIVYVREPGIGDNDPGPEGSGTMTSLEFARKAVAKGAKIDARITRRNNLTNTRWSEIGTTPFLLAAVTADAAAHEGIRQAGRGYPSRPTSMAAMR